MIDGHALHILVHLNSLFWTFGWVFVLLRENKICCSNFPGYKRDNFRTPRTQNVYCQNVQLTPHSISTSCYVTWILPSNKKSLWKITTLYSCTQVLTLNSNYMNVHGPPVTLFIKFYCDRDITKISSYWGNTTSTWGIKQPGISSSAMFPPHS